MENKGDFSLAPDKLSWSLLSELIDRGRIVEACAGLQYLAGKQDLGRPERLRAALLAAELALVLGRNGLAARYLEQARRLGPEGQVAAHLGLLETELLVRTGRFHEAAVALQESPYLDSPSWVLLSAGVRGALLQGELELQFGNLGRAEEWGLRAADLARQMPRALVLALLLRGIARWRARRLEQAWELLGEAVERAEESGDLYLLGRACLLAGRFLGETGFRKEGVPEPATLLARAHESFREAGSLRDMDEVRTAFRAHGRRLSDRLADEPITLRAEDVASSLRSLAGLSERLSVELAEAGGGEDARRASLAFLVDLDRALLRSAGALEALLETAGEVVVRQQRLTELFRALQRLTSPLEPGEFAQVVVRLASELMGATRVVLALENRRGELVVHGEQGEGGDDWRELCVLALRGGRPALSEGGRLRKPVGQELAAPLWTGSRAIGAIYVAEPESGGVFSASDEGVLRLFALQVAAILEHQRSRWALRVAARTREGILEAISDGVVLADPDGVIRYANGVAGRLLGRRAEDLTGLSLVRVLGSRLGAEWKHLDGQAVRFPGGEAVVHARIIRDDSGSEAGVVLSLAEMRLAKKTAQRLVGATARYAFEDIVTQDQEMAECIRLAQASAATDSNVLITGESGTGKEVFAQAIHNASSRASGPFVGINCAAIPRDLLESELFGYEEGAFTGARRGGRPGKFEVAEGGTILLDEIGDMPLEMQAKLLRVLQERHFRRVGGSREIPLGARLVATTNRDLEELVLEGGFREDLYYRLKVIEIRLPPLRERPADIPLLARHFLKVFAEKLGKQVRDIAPEVLDAIKSYPWPGNVRQLQHVIESAVSLLPAEARVLDRIPGQLRHARKATLVGLPAQSRRKRPSLTLVEVEKELLVAAMQRYRGSIPEVAKELGVSRGTVYNKLRKFGLDPADFRR